MGYDEDLFADPDRISSVLKCQICFCILENPLVLKKCEHIFCDYCINDWLDRKRKCPICREEVSIVRENDLSIAPLYVRQMVNELQVICEICNKQMNLENLKEHQKSCKLEMSSSSAVGAADKAEINKLKNKIACLEGQLSNKSNECKMISTQRNQLNGEVEKLKGRIKELEEAGAASSGTGAGNVPVTPTPNNPTGLGTSRFLKPNRSNLIGSDMNYPPDFNQSTSTSRSKSPIPAPEPKIKYVTDPSLLAQLAELEATLTSQKTRHERQIKNMEEDFEYQQGRNERRILALTEELAEKEEEMNNNANSLINRSTNVMEISGLSDISGLSAFNLGRSRGRQQDQVQQQQTHQPNAQNLNRTDNNADAMTDDTDSVRLVDELNNAIDGALNRENQGIRSSTQSAAESFRNEFLQQSVPIGNETTSMYNPMGDSDGNGDGLRLVFFVDF